jgi:hypothetical protein
VSQIVHMQTQISVTFGVLSDDGSRQDPQEPITCSLPQFSEEAFLDAFRAIKAEHERRSAIFRASEQPSAEKRAAAKPRARTRAKR